MEIRGVYYELSGKPGVHRQNQPGNSQCPGLDHMRELMKRLGNPQDDLKYVHIAGTNGKGSVIAFLYSVLSGAGYRIGRYVSPTLYSYRGRMEVSGSRISREDFAAYITQVSDVIAAMTKIGRAHV